MGQRHLHTICSGLPPHKCQVSGRDRETGEGGKGEPSCALAVALTTNPVFKCRECCDSVVLLCGRYTL